MPQPAQLPIRRVTFYKHGVSMVEREGRVQGEALQLGFRDGDIDDALKSLTVLDRSGGQVVCIDYQIPAAARRDGNALELGAGSGLLDLVERLTGWRVRAELAGRSAPVEGRVTGVQYAKERRRLKGATLMLLDEQSGAVQAVPAADLVSIVPLEARIGEDLERFLDAGKRSDGAQSVALRLTPGEHDLAVSYLVPAPTWRVSYRVIAESGDGTSAPADATVPNAGKLLLQGWGLVDNRFDEDLENVEVSLVAGQPISFVYDLKTSRVPERRRVEDEARVAAEPVEFEAGSMMLKHSADDDIDFDAAELSEPAAMYAASISELRSSPADRARAAMARMASIRELESAEPASTSADQRETFAYDVLRPVSIPRGSSALVPILRVKLDYRRELLFNETKHQGHPVAALRCANASGLVLERGPATLVEDGRYRGEAIVPFTGRDGSLYLPYAVELGIDARVESDRSTETQALRIGEGLLHEEAAEIRGYRYELVNRTGAEQTVTIERSVASLPGELSGTPEPATHGDGFYRWEVACPPGSTTRFEVRSRRLTERRQHLARLVLQQVAGFLKASGLTANTRKALEALRGQIERTEENSRRVEALAAERKRLVERQEHLRRNIGALAAGGDEGAVRLQMVRELQAAESSLSGIDQRVGQLKDDNARIEQSLGASLPDAA